MMSLGELYAEKKRKKKAEDARIKREFEASHARARKQFDNMHQDAKATEEKVLGPTATMMKLDAESNQTRDYSIFNLVMSVVDFKDCKTSFDSCRKVYDGLYVYLNKAVQRNKSMLHLLAKYQDQLEEADRQYVEELSKAEDFDPYKLAATLLQKLNDRAKERSKSGLIFYDK